MKKLVLILASAMVVFSCEKNTKPVIVGQNEKGEDLIVNAEGDTVVYVAPTTVQTTDSQTEKRVERPAFEEKEGVYDFAFNLKKGETYPFSIATEATNTQSDGKQSQKVTNSSLTALDYTVKEVKDSTYVLDVTFKRFTEKMSNGKKTVALDTDAPKPEDKAAAQRWNFNKAIVGNSFVMEISRKGNVQNIEGLWKTRKAIKSEMDSELKSDEEKAALEEFLIQMLSDEAMQQMFEESISYYPKKAVKKDESWTKKDGDKSAKSEITYTFKGVENGVVTIDINGSSSGSDSQTDQRGIKLFRTLKGNLTGNVEIDANSGWMKHVETKNNEVLRMTQQYKDQKMNYSSTTNSTTKIN